MQRHVPDTGIISLDRNVLGRRRYELTGDRFAPVVVGHDEDCVSGCESIRLGLVRRGPSDRDRVARDIERQNLTDMALAEPTVLAAIGGKAVRKTIVVPNRIVNVVV